MKVKELITVLKKVDPENRVVSTGAQEFLHVIDAAYDYHSTGDIENVVVLSHKGYGDQSDEHG